MQIQNHEDTQVKWEKGQWVFKVSWVIGDRADDRTMHQAWLPARENDKK